VDAKNARKNYVRATRVKKPERVTLRLIVEIRSGDFRGPPFAPCTKFEFSRNGLVRANAVRENPSRPRNTTHANEANTVPKPIIDGGR